MPQGLEVKKEKYAVTLTWQECDSLYYNIYSSDKFPVDIADPANLRRTYSRIACYSEPFPSLVQPRHYAVTAIDRYGNESAPLQWEDRIVLVENRIGGLGGAMDK